MGSARNSSPDALAKAEVKFQQVARRKLEADQALKDQMMARESEASKTTRLRALRLAKEEADREAAAVLAANAPPPSARKKAVRKKVVAE
jgi:hypothetical protein